MGSRSRKPGAPIKNGPESLGLFRTVMAGPGRTLADAFANMERAPQIVSMSRHVARDLLGARVTLTLEEGSGYWELTRIRKELYVIVENFAYKNPRTELVPGDGLLQFNFKISGDMTLGVSRARPFRFNRPSLLIWAQPNGVNVREWVAPGAHERSIAISMHPKLLVEHFLTSVAAIPESLKKFVAGNENKLTYCQLPLTARMFEVATRLINSPYTGSLGLLHIEALTLELICDAVAGFTSMCGEPGAEYTERELKCLHAAHDIVMREFAPPPTIQKLARAVGMSETAMTSGFKALFGETIFECSLRCRMQHALSLLRDKQESVARVSEAIGYAHSTSFATAFRRHFGIRPIDVRHVKAPVARKVRPP